MKKLFNVFAICWALLFILFNVISFAFKDAFGGEFTTAFWSGYGFISIAFIILLGCTYFAFKDTSKEKMFLNIPLIRISYVGLILMLVFGAATMAIPAIPVWVGIVVCFAIVIFTVIAILKASAAAEIVANIDEKVKVQTQFIKLATVNAQNIMNRAKNETAKTECKKVYEALRYSDPMSNDALSVEEAKITVKMDELANAVNTEAENISEIAEEIVLLVKERNNKCKALK